ncbi:hypothetical protein [Promicromonospora umidemergens]|uniref:Uncharacterized protein n=1 Tax=Promicromonospora umidemergens TaxID=629679 RepID=A0ABP8Y4V9_9MICO|nr:hypothetical protein [Promicromonospora umidemergens]
MPREIVILAPRPVTLEDVIRGAREVDPHLFIRVIAHGAFTQLLNDDEQLVVSIGQPALLRAPDEIERLLPGVPVSPELLEAARDAGPDSTPESLPTWTEAHAPLTEVGELGNTVCESIARYVGGTCVVQDDTYRDVP